MAEGGGSKLIFYKDEHPVFLSSGTLSWPPCAKSCPLYSGYSTLQLEWSFKMNVMIVCFPALNQWRAPTGLRIIAKLNSRACTALPVHLASSFTTPCSSNSSLLYGLPLLESPWYWPHTHPTALKHTHTNTPLKTHRVTLPYFSASPDCSTVCYKPLLRAPLVFLASCFLALTTLTAGTANCLPNTHSTFFLVSRALIFLRVTMCSVKKIVTFPDSLAAVCGHMT